jgi:Ser/Thr protein kinase RdoA (MazF antagonist)
VLRAFLLVHSLHYYLSRTLAGLGATGVARRKPGAPVQVSTFTNCQPSASLTGVLNNFEHLLPEVIFDAVEILGGRCTGRFLALNAMENRVYEIEMEEGPKLVAKFYRPGRWNRSNLQAEHSFLKALDQNEIPVVCPLLDKNGNSLHEIQGIFYTIFPKKQGRLEPELNQEQLERLGRFLARLHNVGASHPKVERPRLDIQTFAREPLQLILDLNLIQPSLAPRFSQLVDNLCKYIEPVIAGGEYILLHGDCHAGNILWNGNDPFFIDFDDMIYAPPVQDIWMLTGGDDDYARENRMVLLESYEQIRAFDWPSLKWIEHFRALRMIYFNGWIARRHTDGAFKMAFPAFGTERYWQEQIEGLSMQLEKISQGS